MEPGERRRPEAGLVALPRPQRVSGAHQAQPTPRVSAAAARTSSYVLSEALLSLKMFARALLQGRTSTVIKWVNERSQSSLHMRMKARTHLCALANAPMDARAHPSADFEPASPGCGTTPLAPGRRPSFKTEAGPHLPARGNRAPPHPPPRSPARASETQPQDSSQKPLPLPSASSSLRGAATEPFEARGLPGPPGAGSTSSSRPRHLHQEFSAFLTVGQSVASSSLLRTLAQMSLLNACDKHKD